MDLKIIFIAIFGTLFTLAVARILYIWWRGYSVYLTGGRIVTVTNEGVNSMTTPIMATATAPPMATTDCPVADQV